MAGRSAADARTSNDEERGAVAPPAATVAFERPRPDELEVRLGGTWRLGSQRPAPRLFAQEIARQPVRRVTFVARDVQAWDTALLIWLRAAFQTAAEKNIEAGPSDLPRGVVELLELARRVVEPPRERPAPRPGLLARIGARAEHVGAGAVETLAFVGRVTLALGRFVTLRAQVRLRDLLAQVQAAGADAVPIITLVSVIVGLILAFVGAVQLRLFGADLYVANLVGIAMVREMGAMVVGIIMAGRTGAAYAAQLGTMKVTEEIDALTTFGISAVDFLVLPRVVALFLMTPFLCLYATVLGCLGGAIVGVGMLGLSPQLYFDQTIRSLTSSDLYGGLFRGTVYGVIIGITGCMRGMRCGDDAAAVGEATTSAVVTAVVVMVVADGIIAVVFNALGI